MAIPLSSDNSNSANLNQVNNVIRQLENESQTKVFKGPNNVNALISGKLPNDLGYGTQFSDSNNVPRIIAYIDSNNQPIFKISESGTDVTSATNDQLIFNSNQNVFKIVDKITITPTKPAAGNVTTTSQAHGLSYVPALMGYINVSGEHYQLPFLSVLPSTGVIATAFEISATTTNVNVTWTSPAAWGGAAPDLTIYLLQETAN